LLCSFASKEELEQVIEEIFKYYSVLNGKVYVLSIQDSEELLVTYNVQSTERGLLANSFVANRKKETNTIYSINALNQLIFELTGTLDKNYRVEWEDYRNMILLTSKQGVGVRKLETRIFRIISK
jgi:hypothetical protein